MVLRLLRKNDETYMNTGKEWLYFLFFFEILLRWENFFSKCNSFFLKFQAKNKLKKLGNTKNLLNEKASYARIQAKLKLLMKETIKKQENPGK